MDIQETPPLMGVSWIDKEPLEQACREQGINSEQLLEAMNKLAEAATYCIESVSAAFASLREALSEFVPPAIRSLGDLLGICDGELFWMVPPHIKHLAYKHPKARVRNKNWNRMWRIRERYMKCHK